MTFHNLAPSMSVFSLWRGEGREEGTKVRSRNSLPQKQHGRKVRKRVTVPWVKERLIRTSKGGQGTDFPAQDAAKAGFLEIRGGLGLRGLVRFGLLDCVNLTRVCVCVCVCACLSDTLCSHFTPAHCTLVNSTCHRCTNAFALAQVVPQNRVPFDMVAERG